MSEADFNTIRIDPRAQTPPPRAYLPTLVPGISFGIQPPADGMNALAPEVTALDQVRNEEARHLSTTDPDENADEAGRFARWLEKKEMEQDNKYNRTVTISPLPDDATVADVLPRIRGGVDSCYVSQFEETRVAVVTFKLAADAITYAQFCKESPIWSLWTFEISRPGVPFTWERRAEVKLYKSAPEMGSVRRDIPTEPRTIVLAGSRCLVYKGCKPHEVATIYRALGLHKSQHQRDQVEGMWLEGPVRDQNGDPVRGNLHVWYTSIKAAQEARVRVTSLEFEYDPCSDSPDKLMLYIDEGDEVPIFKHHEPFVNLIELDQKSILTGVYEGLVDPIQAYWGFRAAAQPAVPDPMADLTARLQWSLQTNSGAPMMSTVPGSYQQSNMILPPAAQGDPFLEAQPIATDLKAQQYNRATTAYTVGPVEQNISAEYQPFAAGRAVPPGHHLSPLETFVARRQERQALGLAPNYTVNKNDVVYRQIQPSSSLIGDANKTSVGVGVIGDSARRSANANITTNQYSNLGGGDDDDTRTNLTDAPQDIQVPGDSAHTNVQDTSLISDSSFLSAASSCAIPFRHADNSDKKEASYVSVTDSDSFTESTVTQSTGFRLRGGKATKSDMITSTDTDGTVEIDDSTPAPGKYSRRDLNTQDVFWTCSLDEFRAMSDKQWASFGTAFYVAPAGFDTATKHVVRLE